MFNPDHRKRAIERLKEHRNEERIKCLKEAELKRVENESFSLLWKMRMKESINGSVEKQIDKQILLNAIKHHAELLEFSPERLEEAWSQLVSGLKVPSRLDLLVDQLSIANPVADTGAGGLLSTGSVPTVAESFLKHTMPQEELETLKMSQQVGLSYLSSLGVSGTTGAGHSAPASDFAQSSLLGRFGNVNSKESMSDPNKLIRSVFLVGPNSSDIEQVLTSHGISRAASESGNISASSGTMGSPLLSTSHSVSDFSVNSWNTNTMGNSGLDHRTSHAGFSGTDRTSMGHSGGNGGGVKAVVDPLILFKTTLDEGLDETLLARLCFPTGIDVNVKIEQQRRSSNSNNTSMTSALSMGIKTPNARRDSLRNSDMKTKQFVFVLTDGHNQNQFAVCTILPRRFVEDGVTIQTEYCLCIVTAYPYLNYFLHLSNQFDAMDGLKLSTALCVQDDNSPLQMELRHLNELSIKLNRQLNPSPGSTLEFALSVKQARVNLDLKRLQWDNNDAEAQYHALLWALPILLRHLPLQEILLALGCMCGEMSVLVTGGDTTQVTAVIIGLLFLLRPLRWAGNIISVLPPAMDGYLDSPVMYIYGMPKCPPYHETSAGQIKIDLMERAVELHGSEAVVSNTLTIPQASKLKELLRKPADIIEKASRRRRNVRVGQMDYAVQTPGNPATGAGPDNSGSANGSGNSWQLPLPTELDIESERSRLLSSAVLNFISIMSTHLTNLLIQSVQVHRDSKLRSRLPSQQSGKPDAAVNKTRASYLKLSDLQQPTTRNHSGSFVTNSTDSSVCTDAEDIMQLMAKSNIYSKLNPQSLKVQGEGATIKFLNKLRETQMFSYYYSNKAQKVRQTKENAAGTDRGAAGAGNGDTFSNEDTYRSEGVAFASSVDAGVTSASASVVASPDSAGGKSPPAFASMKVPLSGRAGSPAVVSTSPEVMPGQGNVQGQPPGPKADPLVDLFSIILSGTMALSSTRVNELKSDYESGKYPEGCGCFKRGHGHWRRNKHLHSSKMSRTSLSDGSPLGGVLRGNGHCSDHGHRHSHHSPDRASSLSFSIDDMEVSGSEGEDGSSDGSDDSDSDGGSNNNLVWCNGYCGGLANTSTCTLLCLELWKQRVSFLRKQQIVRHIIQKHQNRDIVPEQVQLPDGHVITTLPKVEPKRHGKETISQYEKRKFINNNAHQPPRKARRTGNSCLDSFTRYYADKLQRQRKLSRMHALVTLKPIFMKLRLRVWRNNRVRAAVLIQGLARGYVVRYNIEYVVNILETRKKLRLMACLIIRNWLREQMSKRSAIPTRKNRSRLSSSNKDVSSPGLPLGKTTPTGPTGLGGRRATMGMAGGGGSGTGRNRGNFLQDKASPGLAGGGSVSASVTPTGSSKVGGWSAGKKSPLRSRFSDESPSNDSMTVNVSTSNNSANNTDIASSPRGAGRPGEGGSLNRYSTMQSLGDRTVSNASAAAASLHTMSAKNHSLHPSSGASSSTSSTSSTAAVHGGSRQNSGTTTATAATAAMPTRPNTLVTGKRVSLNSMTSSKPLSAFNYSNRASTLARHSTMFSDGSGTGVNVPSEAGKPNRSAMSPGRGGRQATFVTAAKHPAPTQMAPVNVTAVEPATHNVPAAIAVSAASENLASAASKHTTPTHAGANAGTNVGANVGIGAGNKVAPPVGISDRRGSRGSIGSDSSTKDIDISAPVQTPTTVTGSASTSVVPSETHQSGSSPPYDLQAFLTGIPQVGSGNASSSASSVSSADTSRKNSEDATSAHMAVVNSVVVNEGQKRHGSADLGQGASFGRGGVNEGYVHVQAQAQGQGQAQSRIGSAAQSPKSQPAAVPMPGQSQGLTQTQVQAQAQGPAQGQAKVKSPAERPKSPEREGREYVTKHEGVLTADALVRRTSSDSPNEALLTREQNRRQHLRSMSMTSVEGGDTINSDIDYPRALQASLGEAGRTEMTNQQRQIVMKMYDMLRNGVEVIKHSKTGNPKLRKLFCDADMTHLYWREEKDTAEDVDRKMKQKRRTSIFNKDDSERELLFSSIIGMHTDFSSEVFKRAIHNRKINVAEDCFILTLVTNDRTLDVELMEADHTPLHQAFLILIEFYNNSLPEWKKQLEFMSPVASRRASVSGLDWIADDQYTTNLLHNPGGMDGKSNI